VIKPSEWRILLGLTTQKKKIGKNISIKYSRNLRGKSKLGKTTESNTNPLFSERLQKWGERTSQPLYSMALYQQVYRNHTPPNDGASPIIEMTRVTSYEITELPLTCSPNFAGKKASQMNCFQAGPLPLCTSGNLLCLCCYEVLLRLGASE